MSWFVRYNFKILQLTWNNQRKSSRRICIFIFNRKKGTAMVNKNNIGGLGIKNIFLTLLIAICLAGLYYGFVHLKLIIAKSPQQVRLYYKKVYHFSEQEKADFLKRHAGLWKFNIETMSGGKTVKKTDRIEIKDNGIIWQVIEWTIPMPSDSIITFRQIRTAYLKPYGVVRGDSICDAFVLSQAFITGKDTCIGAWNFPELWSFQMVGSSLILNKRRYTFYNGELDNFFPAGSVAFVQSVENHLLKDTVIKTGPARDTIPVMRRIDSVRIIDKKTGAVSIEYSLRWVDFETGNIIFFPIRDTLSNLYDLFRIAINRECREIRRNNVNQDTIIAFLERYYDSFIISEKLRNFPRELPTLINASFIVKPGGSVDSITLTSTDEIDKMLSEDLSKEISSWRLPFPGEPIKVVHAFKMP
jgi:hypothetical protein